MASGKTSRGPAEGPPRRLRVVLAGGGHAHLAVLEDWRTNPLLAARCTLITPDPTMLYSGMVPGWIEGIYRRSDLEIDVRAIAAAAGVECILDTVVALDTARRSLSLASGRTIGYDVLSLAIGGEPAFPSSGRTGSFLPVRPLEQFLSAWRTYELTRSGPVQRIAVIGGGAAGTEIALAIAARFDADPVRTEIALFAGPEGLLPGHANEVRAQARARLDARGVKVTNTLVLPDAGESAGNELKDFDLTVVATGNVPAAWLSRAGLALGPGGGVAVSPELRSTSHPQVLAAGDVSERMDRSLARSGVHAVKAGPILAANLRAIAERRALRRYDPRENTLYLVSTGERAAILSWGRFTARGHWVWRLKNFIDRRFVGRYQRIARLAAADRKRLPMHKALAKASVIRTAAHVSLVVGTCLNAINQGDEILAGEPVSLGRIMLNYLVPFSVAAFSGARARQTARSMDEADAAELDNTLTRVTGNKR